MTQTVPTRNIAPLHNLGVVRSFAKVADRTKGLPGIAALYGPAGWGKSTAAMAIANEHRAYYVSVRSAWSRKTLLEKILLEMGVKTSGTIPRLLDAACDQLGASRRMLMIDEFDYCAKSDSMVELVRDVYEGSECAMLIIGEELLPQKLKRWERFHSRVMTWMPAQAVSVKDAELLAPIYAPGVRIERALLAHLVEASQGSVRRVCVNLNMIRETSQMEGWDAVGRAEWGDRPLYTGEAPRRSV